MRVNNKCVLGLFTFLYVLFNTYIRIHREREWEGVRKREKERERERESTAGQMMSVDRFCDSLFILLPYFLAATNNHFFSFHSISFRFVLGQVYFKLTHPENVKSISFCAVVFCFFLVTSSMTSCNQIFVVLETFRFLFCAGRTFHFFLFYMFFGSSSHFLFFFVYMLVLFSFFLCVRFHCWSSLASSNSNST